MTTVGAPPRRRRTGLWVAIAIFAALVAVAVGTLILNNASPGSLPGISMPTPLSPEEKELKLYFFESQGTDTVDILGQTMEVTRWTKGEDFTVFVQNSTGALAGMEKDGVLCKNPGAFSTYDALLVMVVATEKPGIGPAPTVVTVSSDDGDITDGGVPYEVTCRRVA